jgi:imidazolonepropionase-like amidohydrolase
MRLRPVRAALVLSLAAAPAAAQRGDSAVTLRAARVLDGTGRLLTNVDIVVRAGRIARVRPAAGPLPRGAVDLRALTVLPGLIDTHVHLGWYVNARDRLHTADDGEGAEVQALNWAANAWATLRAGSRRCRASARRRTARCATRSRAGSCRGRGSSPRSAR